MTVKEYLNQIRAMNDDVNRMIQQKENLQGVLYCIGSPGTGEKVQTSKSVGSRHEDLFAKISEKEEQINKSIDDLVSLKWKISEQINELPNVVHISVLYERYINLKSWNKIADELGYNTRYLFHVHGNALHEFHKKYEKELNADGL